jgi:hypothetical protein
MRYDSLPEITMKLYHPPSQIATGFPTPRMRSLSLSCDEDVLRPNHCASPPERASNYVSNGRAPAAGKTGLSRRCLALESFAPARFLTARSSSSSSSSRTLGSSHLIGEGGEQPDQMYCATTLEYCGSINDNVAVAEPFVFLLR